MDFDLFIIGGGINGCGIARDAAGRGLRVGLAEMDDLAAGTSSGSTKLFHGGLRYLEYFELRLVREALRERETLLRAMPHISWPMRFVLPIHPGMRFDAETPASRVLSVVMPWLWGRRPAWMIRLGLFFYDRMGARELLPGAKTLDLRGRPEGAPLDAGFARAFEYSDCWVDDARLVVLNARDAAARGARIWTRTKVTRAVRDGDGWRVTLEGVGEITTRVLVNAGGPWVGQVIEDVLPVDTGEGVRLVRGSHIVVPRLYDHDKCYFLQGSDGRIIFTIPYEDDFTLIGTTDADHGAVEEAPVCSAEEQAYLIDFANRYFRRQLTAQDVVWTYSGVRPLYDDGAASATAATREYLLSLEASGPPVLNVFGGKITTYRRLAEAAMARLAPYFEGMSGDWTAGVALPGGDFPVEGVAELRAGHAAAFPFLTSAEVARLTRCYGTEVPQVLGHAQDEAALGRRFGGVSERELEWSIREEFARTPEDFLWRRTKQGLHLLQSEVQELSAVFKSLIKQQR